MKKKNVQQIRRSIRNAAIGVAVVALAVIGWYGVRMYQNRKMTEAMIAERNAATVQQESGQAETDAAGLDDEEVDLSTLFAQDMVRWQGKTYRRNTYVKSILCMGVDRSDAMNESRGFNEAGQADGIFLIAQDTAHNDLKILMIPRDTMTEISIINEDMSDAGKMVRQLTLAYANGDGRERSCENVRESTQQLLGGFSIDHYLAADTKVISSLNDAVGGVTVTVPTSGMEKRDPAFVQGETITLHGAQAEAFVRYRDITRDYSALYRMDQQQEYITRYFRALQDKSKEDSQIVTRLFDMIQDYMVTDMGKETYLKIAVDALQKGSLEKDDFYTLPGSGVTTDLYEEYYVDPKASVPILLNLFYREV